MILKLLGITLLSVVLAIPLTILVVLNSGSVLRGIERRWEIEVIGHSGPADWVILVIWLMLSLTIAGTIAAIRNRRGKTE